MFSLKKVGTHYDKCSDFHVAAALLVNEDVFWKNAISQADQKLKECLFFNWVNVNNKMSYSSLERNFLSHTKLLY